MAIAIEPLGPPTGTPPEEAAPATPPPEEAAPAEAPVEEAKPELPDELLKVPALQALFAGSPPALSAKVSSTKKSPVAKLITKHKDELMNSGIGFYRSINGDTAVVFNMLYVSPDQIKQADKAGKLLEVAPSFEQVNNEVEKAHPTDNPVMKNKGVPQGLAAAPPVTPPQSATAPMPQPSQAQLSQIQRERLNNLKPQPATKGPAAGQGSLLRSILKPVV